MRFSHLLRALRWIPTLSLLSFFGFVFLITLLEGHWPSYGNPDAGAFQGVLRALDAFVFFLAGISIPAICVLAGTCLVKLTKFPKDRSPAERRELVMDLTIVLAWIGLLGLDPFGFVDWFLD